MNRHLPTTILRGWAGSAQVARVVASACVMLLFASTGCRTIKTIHAKHHIHVGDRLLREHDLEAALARFEAAAELAPQMAVAHSKIGGIYRQMGSYERAIDAFVDALQQNPFSFPDTISLAQLYHFTNRITEAIGAYLHAIDLEPEDFDAHVNLGVCYEQSGELYQAVEQFRRAIEIDPTQPHSFVNLGVVLDRQKKYYEAIRAYKDALERDSRQPLLLVNLARTYMNQDRLRMAKNALEQAIVMDPNLGVAHEALGYTLFRGRDFDAARKAYSLALACDPNLPKSHSGLGSIQMLRFLEDPSQNELRSAALEHWHRSLELNPNQPRIRKLIARYRPGRGDPGDALLQSSERVSSRN